MSLLTTPVSCIVTYTYKNYRNVVDDRVPVYPKTVSEAKWNELKSALGDTPTKTRRVSRYYDLRKVDEQEYMRRNEIPKHPVIPVCYLTVQGEQDIYEEVVLDTTVRPTEIIVTCERRIRPTFPVQYKFYNIQHHIEHVFHNPQKEEVIFSQYTERGNTYHEHYVTHYSSSWISSASSSSR
jgi:hypothetical protein